MTTKDLYRYGNDMGLFEDDFNNSYDWFGYEEDNQDLNFNQFNDDWMDYVEHYYNPFVGNSEETELWRLTEGLVA